jgi:RHS repeat-associated protein
MKTQSGRGQNDFQEESSSFSVTVSAGNVGSQAAVTYTRGVDLSGTLQGAGGIGGLLARTDMGQWIAGTPWATAYYFADAQGNVDALVYTNGLMAAEYEYDPYGNIVSMSGPIAGANKYRFSSKEWNDNASLYYYGFRFYDPNLQRWPNRDPIGEWGGLNLFGFVANNPLKFFDVLGDCYYIGGNSGHVWAAVDTGNGEVLRYDYAMQGYNGNNGSSQSSADAAQALSGAPGYATVGTYNSIQQAAGNDTYYKFNDLPGEDAVIAQNMQQSVNNPPEYKLLSNNCGNQSCSVVGWATTPVIPTPNNFLNMANQQWNQMYNSPPMNVSVNYVAQCSD